MEKGKIEFNDPNYRPLTLEEKREQVRKGNPEGVRFRNATNSVAPHAKTECVWTENSLGFWQKACSLFPNSHHDWESEAKGFCPACGRMIRAVELPAPSDVTEQVKAFSVQWAKDELQRTEPERLLDGDPTMQYRLMNAFAEQYSAEKIGEHQVHYKQVLENILKGCSDLQCIFFRKNQGTNGGCVCRKRLERVISDLGPETDR